MLVGRFRASLAHDHVWYHVHVRSKFVARYAHRALSVLVDQQHRPSLSFLPTLVAHSVSSGATFSRIAGFVRLRSKPPCLITLTARGVASLRSTAVPPTSTPTPDAFPANRDGLPGSGFPRRQSSRGSGRLMRPPRGALRRSAQTRGRRPPARHPLPTFHNHIHVLWIQLDAVADSFCDFRGCQGRSRSQEGLVNRLATLRVVQQRTAHQLDRLLCRMVKFLFVRAAHYEFGRGASPDRRVLPGLAEPGRVLFPDVPARLVLEPIMSAR